MYYAAAILCSGLARALVGGGISPRTVLFATAGLLAVALGPAHPYWHLYGPALLDLSWRQLDVVVGLPLLLFVAPWVTLTWNIYDWNDRPGTAFQWSFGPLLVAAAVSLHQGFFYPWQLFEWVVTVGPFLGWAALCGLVGWSYVDLLAFFNEHLPKQTYLDAEGMLAEKWFSLHIQGRDVALDPSRASEFLLGCTVQGLVVFLGYVL